MPIHIKCSIWHIALSHVLNTSYKIARIARCLLQLKAVKSFTSRPMFNDAQIRHIDSTRIIDCNFEVFLRYSLVHDVTKLISLIILWVLASLFFRVLRSSSSHAIEADSLLSRDKLT